MLDDSDSILAFVRRYSRARMDASGDSLDVEECLRALRIGDQEPLTSTLAQFQRPEQVVDLVFSALLDEELPRSALIVLSAKLSEELSPDLLPIQGCAYLTLAAAEAALHSAGPAECEAHLARLGPMPHGTDGKAMLWPQVHHLRAEIARQLGDAGAARTHVDDAIAVMGRMFPQPDREYLEALFQLKKAILEPKETHAAATSTGLSAEQQYLNSKQAAEYVGMTYQSFQKSWRDNFPDASQVGRTYRWDRRYLDRRLRDMRVSWDSDDGVSER